jgi:hypothetical protein
MQFRSLPLLAGLVIASMACFGRPAFADAYYLERWSAGASVSGVPFTGGFVYDATTGGVIGGNNTSIPGFCASGGCAFNINARNAVVVSDAAGASVQLTFNDATFGTIGPHLLNLAINGPLPDVFGGPILGLSVTGGLNVSTAPAPAPGVGLASLFALAAAIFGSRRLRDGLPPRG